MKYALWNLKLDTPNYLTGPEGRIAELGARAEASVTNGDVTNAADILGYVTGDFDVDEVSHWNYREITQAEALSFAQSISPAAFIDDDGKIWIPIEEN